ncbi:PilZ domain-containing protein [Myxococcota bacterium]
MVDNSNTRRHARHQLEAEIEVGDGHLGGELVFDSHNVSRGGLFLKSDLLLEVGDTVWVSFALPRTAVAIRTRGRVVWVNRNPDENDPTDRPGMGIQFLDLTEVEETALTAYLEETTAG